MLKYKIYLIFICIYVYNTNTYISSQVMHVRNHEWRCQAFVYRAVSQNRRVMQKIFGEELLSNLFLFHSRIVRKGRKGGWSTALCNSPQYNLIHSLGALSLSLEMTVKQILYLISPLPSSSWPPTTRSR